MKKYLFPLMLAALLLAAGCIGEKVVEKGDRVSVNYVGRLEDGSIFDTNIVDVAKAEGIYDPGRSYKPFNFTIRENFSSGRGEVILGIEEGVLGMKVGETKTITVPPEKGYGEWDPRLVQRYPTTSEMPLTQNFTKTFDMDLARFKAIFSQEPKAGLEVTTPNSDVNLTVLEFNETTVTLDYNLKVGDTFRLPNSPWDEEVIRVDDNNITIRHNVTVGETFSFHQTPWNTTVVNITGNNVTLRHNPIEETRMMTPMGFATVRFVNDTIEIDRNPKLAGKTLIFNVTILSIS